MSMRVILGIFTLLLLSVSCTKEDPRLNKFDLIKLILAKDKNAEIIKQSIPKGGKAPIRCENYIDRPEGMSYSDYESHIDSICARALPVRVINLEIVVIEFNTIDEAKSFGSKLNAFVLKNWVFDDVSGEPDLEKFFKSIGAAHANAL